MEEENSTYRQVNEEIFRYLNTIFGKPEFDEAINWGAQIGESDNFLYYVLVLAIIFSWQIFQSKHNIETLKLILISWFTVGLVLTISLAVGHVSLVLTIKNYTNMPRPFCSLENINIVPAVTDKLECKMSFPSGHMAFLTTMIAGFWPLMSKIIKVLSVITLIFVATTRIAAGAHYPIDIIGAVALTLPLTILIHKEVEPFIKHYENKKGYFAKILNYIFKLGIK